jgi:hypothetical protein
MVLKPSINFPFIEDQSLFDINKRKLPIKFKSIHKKLVSQLMIKKIWQVNFLGTLARAIHILGDKRTIFIGNIMPPDLEPHSTFSAQAYLTTTFNL